MFNKTILKWCLSDNFSCQQKAMSFYKINGRKQKRFVELGSDLLRPSTTILQSRKVGNSERQKYISYHCLSTPCWFCKEVPNLTYPLNLSSHTESWYLSNPGVVGHGSNKLWILNFPPKIRIWICLQTKIAVK